MTLPVAFSSTVTITCWRFIVWRRGFGGFRSTFGGMGGKGRFGNGLMVDGCVWNGVGFC